MRIVVVGGTGPVGSRLVTLLDSYGHETVAASPDSGVNPITDEGLADLLVGAAVVVDVSHSPSLDDETVMQASPRGRAISSCTRSTPAWVTTSPCHPWAPS